MIRQYLGKIAFIVLFNLPLCGDVLFTQKVSKENVYINETIKVTLELKVSNEDTIDEVYFEEYDTYQFWVTLLKERVVKREKDFTTYNYEYLLEAKKEGLYTLDEQMIKISSKKIRENKRRLKIYSNPILIKVLPLYNNIPVQGEHYTIKAEVDKTSIKANEAVNLTLKIKGKGNLKDIKKFELPLKNQTVYTDKPTVKAIFTDRAFEGELDQKFLIISDKSFTIPTLELKYFNPITKTTQIVNSEPIFIDVKTVKKENGDPIYIKYIFLLLGLIFGIFTYKFFNFIKSKFIQKKHPLEVKIKKVKNHKELYQVLIQNNYNGQFDNIIESFEVNIYKSNKSKSLNDLSKQCLNLLK